MAEETRAKSRSEDARKRPLGSSLVPVSNLLPPNLLLIPVSQTTFFPGMVVPLIIPEGKLTKTVDHAVSGSGYVGVVLAREGGEATTAIAPSPHIPGVPDRGFKEQAPELKKFFGYGVAAKILKKINLPDNQASILLTGLQRFRIKNVVAEDPYYVASVDYLHDELTNDVELEALVRSALNQFKAISKDNPLISEEVKVALVNIDGPSKLCDFMASVLVRDMADYQKLLSIADVKMRLQHLLMHLQKEEAVQAVQRRISDEVHQKISTAQREFVLQEQLKLIQKELGRASDDRNSLLDKFRARLEGKTLDEEAKKRVSEEIEKLGLLHEHSSEYSVAVNYLDWATSLPWGVKSKEFSDLKRASQVLDRDHFGLKDVKERVLEFLAVKKLKQNSEGSILCFVGPPGTGKTSMAKSIAEALGRGFFRFSVGGMRDEAEVKGHRRTYVGAMPGKIIQGLKRSGFQNPVFLIDEIDKLSFGTSGDPASALLEVLDPEQNKAFLDHYLDIPFDCSQVFFITTGNTVDTIPPALLDRMEVIPLHGYTDPEKFKIARKYLFPRQLQKHGLSKEHLKVSDAVLRDLISRYARESGVRTLEKQIARLCRKVAHRVAKGNTRPVVLTQHSQLVKFLGQPTFDPKLALAKTPGVVTGLAWTPFGGDVLQVESVVVDGKGGYVLTGSLGDVMQESANIAYTFVRERARKMGLKKNYFDEHVLHLHVPAGATPKDGPSAGVTMALSLFSLLTRKQVPEGIALTGELTLTGRVLPVGGIKEKMLAAKRNGIKRVILPRANERDYHELELPVRQGLKVFFVSSMDDVLRIVFSGLSQRR